jgi:hypothetical protein
MATQLTPTMALPYPDYVEIADMPLQATALAVSADAQIGGAWVQYQPRVWTVNSLRPITTTNYMRYKKVGKRVWFQGKVQTPNGSSGSGFNPYMELPFVPEGSYWSGGVLPTSFPAVGVVPIGSVMSYNAAGNTGVWQPVAFPESFAVTGYGIPYLVKMVRVSVAWGVNDYGLVDLEYDSVA